MAKNFVLKKAKDVKEAKANVLAQPWAEPLGVALGITGSICKGFSGFVPGLVILEGACKMGSSFLNPEPTLHDINRQTTELSQQILGIKDEIQDIKGILEKTYEVIRDVRYKDGIESVDSAFENYLDGAMNMKQTFEQLEGFIFELQSTAKKSLNPGRIREYMLAMKDSSTTADCQKMVQYIYLVKIKYLIMTSSYYHNKEDFHRVAVEYTNFNDGYLEIADMFEKEFGTSVLPGSSNHSTDDVSSPEENSRLTGKHTHINKYTLCNDNLLCIESSARI